MWLWLEGRAGIDSGDESVHVLFILVHDRHHHHHYYCY